MRSPEQILENLSKQSVKHSKDDKYKFNELYKHFLNPLFYKHFAASDASIQNIINCMQNESYQPRPVRKTGVAVAADRYVQEIAKELLTIIYEPLLSKDSYGFGQDPNYHNAIHTIQTTFSDTLWFIKGDICDFFHNIDHHIMIEILKKKIDDERFIRMIWKFLKVGLSVPPYGIIGPLLASIYLNEFDKHIKMLQTSIKSRFKKICYVRYGSEFILGVICSRNEAENLKHDIADFLKEQLKVAHEKMLIKHSKDKTIFLSYEISIYQKGLFLTMPKDIIIKKLKELDLVEDFNAKVWKAKRNTKIIGNSDLEIIKFYNEQITRLYNYFCLAINISGEMNTFYQIMKWSMFHTLAAKYKTTVPKMLKKYRIGNTNEYGVFYETETSIQICKFYHDGFKRKRVSLTDLSNSSEL